MVLDELAREVFGFLCHQDLARSLAPGGLALAMCARCTGVYVGFILALPLIFQARCLKRNMALWLHGAFVLQVAVFGFHLVPHGPTVRLLSGQLFGAGVLYFLSTPVLPQRFNPAKTEPRRLLRYLLAVFGLLLSLQLLWRLPWAGAAGLLNALSLLGLGLFLASSVTFLLASARTIASQLPTGTNQPLAGIFHKILQGFLSLTENK